MDWTLAIERNRDALKRIVTMLAAMAEIAGPASPLAAGEGSVRRGEADALGESGERPSAPTLPRHLHRAILRLLRPAESAVRRLIIVMARGLVVTLPALSPRKVKPTLTILRNGVGTGIIMPQGSMPGVRAAPRTLALPLLDPVRSFRPRRSRASGVPRISLPGVAAPFPIAPRRPPTSEDLLDATRLALRLEALGAALDDLPGQARRFARWKANRGVGRTRRVWPLRPGRSPGQLRPNRRMHEVHEILNDLHGLAFDVLECPDTS